MVWLYRAQKARPMTCAEASFAYGSFCELVLLCEPVSSLCEYRGGVPGTAEELCSAARGFPRSRRAVFYRLMCEVPECAVLRFAGRFGVSTVDALSVDPTRMAG